jgi:hypothetical protein
MTPTRHLAVLACAALLSIRTPAAELLRLDFDDPAQLGTQASPLPAGEPVGAVKPSATAGAADFRGGLIKVPGFKGPQGSFSIEARFRLRSYGPESSRFVADILNTATWDNGPSQGFAFRVGGSYLYPFAPREAYRTEAEWLEGQGAVSHIDRGRLSVCFADFVIARADDNRQWKQALTDRCIPLNEWTHLAAVWDGADMRIYLDGLDATDQWRVDGKSAPTRIDTVETAYVGSRIEGEWDPRHLDGDLDFVKVEDKALTAIEIHERYKQTFRPETRESLCLGVVIPHYPEAGAVCKGKLRLEIKVYNHGACTDPKFIAGLLAGDSVELEIAKDPSFKTVLVRAIVAGTAFELEAKDLAPLAGYTGEIFWRVRLKPKTPALAKSAAAPVPEPAWSPSRPLGVDLSGITVGLRQGPTPRIVRVGSGLFPAGPADAAPVLFELSGRRLPARFERTSGGWRLLSEAPQGLLLAR